MQAGAVGRVNRALQYLRPVARDDDFGNRDLGVNSRCPGGRFKLGLRLGRPHVGPDKTAPLFGWVRQVLGRSHARRCGLRHTFHHVAIHIHLPAVVQAAQAAVFIAAKHQRHAAMRAVLVHHADAAVRVAKHHQVFAKNLRFDGRAVRLAHLFHQTHGCPVAAHQLAHGRFAFYAAKQMVFFMRQHVWVLSGLQIQMNAIILSRLRLFPVSVFVKTFQESHR